MAGFEGEAHRTNTFYPVAQGRKVTKIGCGTLSTVVHGLSTGCPRAIFTADRLITTCLPTRTLLYASQTALAPIKLGERIFFKTVLTTQPEHRAMRPSASGEQKKPKK